MSETFVLIFCFVNLCFMLVMLMMPSYWLWRDERREEKRKAGALERGAEGRSDQGSLSS